MKRIIDGQTYDTDTSTLVARSWWLDWEKNDAEIQSELYVTRGGAFFLVHTEPGNEDARPYSSRWRGTRSTTGSARARSSCSTPASSRSPKRRPKSVNPRPPSTFGSALPQGSSRGRGQAREPLGQQVRHALRLLVRNDRRHRHVEGGLCVLRPGGGAEPAVVLERTFCRSQNRGPRDLGFRHHSRRQQVRVDVSMDGAAPKLGNKERVKT